jgi:hypothetical protein
MRITFDLPHVFFPGSDQEENAHALGILLACLVRLNRAYLRNHSVPALYQSGVVYGRTQVWDTIPALYQRGYGDCKSLTAALIAEYLQKGIACKPVFRWMPRQDGSGNTDYHILVLKESGKSGVFEDPSKVLGMGQNENAHFAGGRRAPRIY